MTTRVSDDTISLKSLEDLIKVEQKRLEEDKLKFKRNSEYIARKRSDVNHNQPTCDTILLNEKYDLLPSTEVKCTEQDKNKICMITSPREEEINKFIDKISKPSQSFPSNKELRKSFNNAQTKRDLSQYISPINIREREKDQLSEKFASSESPLAKPTCRQIAKNLYSSISFNNCKTNNLVKANDTGQHLRNVKKDYYSAGKKFSNEEEREEYLRAKYNHPRIVISHHKESDPEEAVENSKHHKMVRIGEFSPLNPNLPGGATVLGLGEWDEKRQLLLQKYKQVSRSPSPSPCEGSHNLSQRSVAIQTDMVDDLSSSITLEKSHQYSCISQEKSPQYFHEEIEARCTSPQLRQSPIPKCFENMTEKEVKEFIYRQELEKQIEEKNRLREESKKKEAEEEAKIEAKIQRDLEKMRQQYEKERLQRLELAIRRKEQEDLFRQRLAVEQQKALQESKIIKKLPVKNKSALTNYTCEQYEKSTHSDYKILENASVTRTPHSQLVPEPSAAASALSNAQDELRQPIFPSGDLMSGEGIEKCPREVEYSENLPKSTKFSTTYPTSPPIPVRRSKEVDILARKALFNANYNTSPRITNTSLHPDTVRDRLKEVDNMLKQPLLPESSRALPPVSQPLLHATIPPLSSSLQSPRVTGSNRINADILDDKWKVPYVEQDKGVAPNTKHNPRILTQLGTFRRQLQEESIRMRQRVREDSP